MGLPTKRMHKPSITRWYWTTIGLYLLCLICFVFPLFLDPEPNPNWRFLYFKIYVIGLMPLMLLIQAALLIVPARMVARRPTSKRDVRITVVACGLAMAILSIGILIGLDELLPSRGQWAPEQDRTLWDTLLPFLQLGLPPAMWIGWSVFFYKCDPYKQPKTFVENIANWLLRGSIIEILIAIPAHISARKKSSCCAPDAITLLGLAAGLSIALLAFGPTVFVLFYKKMKQKTKAQASAEPSSED